MITIGSIIVFIVLGITVWTKYIIQKRKGKDNAENTSSK